MRGHLTTKDTFYCPFVYFDQNIPFMTGHLHFGQVSLVTCSFLAGATVLLYSSLFPTQPPTLFADVVFLSSRTVLRLIESSCFVHRCGISLVVNVPTVCDVFLCVFSTSKLSRRS